MRVAKQCPHEETILPAPETRSLGGRIALFLAAILCCGHASADEWLLFGRHGECAPLATLKRKLPDLPDIRTPDDFAAYLRARGLSFTRRTERAAAVEVEAFDVPDAGLALLLVPRSRCGAEAQRSGAAAAPSVREL